MLLIFRLNLRKDQLKRKPGKCFLARGPVRLGGGAEGPNAGKDATGCCRSRTDSAPIARHAAWPHPPPAAPVSRHHSNQRNPRLRDTVNKLLRARAFVAVPVIRSVTTHAC